MRYTPTMAGAPVATPIDEVSVFREHYQRFRGVTLQTLKLVPEDSLHSPWRELLVSYCWGLMFIAC